MTLGKILIAEDDNDINHLISDVLTRAGYMVTQAFSGTEAKLYWNSEAFDLLLCDLMLPGMTGEELVAEIVEARDAITPIIIISAKNTVMDKVDLLKLGASDYITKPFDIEELLARVEVQLRKKKSRVWCQRRLGFEWVTFVKGTIQCSIGRNGYSLNSTGIWDFAVTF